MLLTMQFIKKIKNISFWVLQRQMQESDEFENRKYTGESEN